MLLGEVAVAENNDCLETLTCCITCKCGQTVQFSDST